MKNIITLLLILFLSACELQFDTPSVGVTYTYVADVCGEDPYWHEPDWCDYYSDGETCCSWWTFDHYEEWCQWDYDWCWEYNGSF
jgi:hypothetical protein